MDYLESKVRPQEEMIADCGPECNYHMYRGIHRLVEGLGVKEKRDIFKSIRNGKDVDSSTFLAKYGLTVGNFCVFYVLTDKEKKK